MYKRPKKAMIFVVLFILLCICIAAACFGASAYIVAKYRGTETVSQSTADLAKVLFMTGIFFLVVAFGYMLLPLIVAFRKKKSGESAPSYLFTEADMRRLLDKYIPDGETLLAGIPAVSKKTTVYAAFDGCFAANDRLVPAQDGKTVALMKQKVNPYGIYLGITQNYLVMTDYEQNSFYYQFDDKPNSSETKIQTVAEDILLADIGKCFSLTDIEKCEFKKGFWGEVNGVITMKNGSCFKLSLPAVLVEHQPEYRKAIIARLSEINI